MFVGTYYVSLTINLLDFIELKLMSSFLFFERRIFENERKN